MTRIPGQKCGWEWNLNIILKISWALLSVHCIMFQLFMFHKLTLVIFLNICSGIIVPIPFSCLWWQESIMTMLLFLYVLGYKCEKYLWLDVCDLHSISKTDITLEFCNCHTILFRFSLDVCWWDKQSCIMLWRYRTIHSDTVRYQ